jgi:energy-coupling factor transport system permease protein
VSFYLTLPVAVSVVLVSVFTRAGTTILFTIGPFDATLQGVDFAAQIVIRLLAISLAIGLYGLTTDPTALVYDLERRGVSPRFAFVANATLQAVPSMVERATTIQAAQRARGLDTEGSPVARARGVMPLVAPVILSSLLDVEERSLALDVRGFSRPGRRNLLWSSRDRAVERVARWAMSAALLVVVVLRLSGAFPQLV